MKYLFALSCALAVLGASVAVRTVEDVASMLKKLSLSEAEAKQNIWSSIEGKYLAYSNVDALKTIANGDRPALVRDIAAFAKAYVRTDEFMRQYEQLREDNKPTSPLPPKPMAQQRAEYKHQLDSSLTEAEKSMKIFSKEQQAEMKPMLDAFRQQLKAADDPDNPMFSKEMEIAGNQMYAGQMEEHKRKLSEWSEQYPESPAPMIRTFLEKFLEETKDIDYSAKLIDGPNGKKLFASTEFEIKSSDWKRAYRAGKETVEAGRREAQLWLSELKNTK